MYHLVCPDLRSNAFKKVVVFALCACGCGYVANYVGGSIGTRIAS